MYTTHIDDKHHLDISTEDLKNLDVQEIQDGQFHIIRNNQSFTVTVLALDYEQKQFTLKVNDIVHTVQIEDEFDRLIHQLGMESTVSTKIDNITAPMPGLVLDILVEEGQTIEKGDSLLILEAMKMENVIKSPGIGVIKSISVGNKDAVDKGQILLELE